MKRSTCFTQHSPDTGDFVVSNVLFTSFGNGKSPSPRAKSQRDFRVKHAKAEPYPICLCQGLPLPLTTRALGPTLVMAVQAVRAVERSATECRQTSVAALRPQPTET